MTLRSRLHLLIGLLIFGSVSIVYLSARLVIDGGFSAIEMANLRSQISTAESAVASQLESLKMMAADNGQWDDAYNYIQGTNPGFLTHNYQPEFLRQINVDALIVTDAEGKILDAVIASGNNEYPAVDQDALLQRLTDLHVISSLKRGPEARSGIISLKDGAYLTTASPITRSNGEGETVGRLIFVRRIGRQMTAQMSRSTALKVDIYSSSQALQATHLATPRLRLLRGEDQVIDLAGETEARVFTLLRNPAGQSSALLQITTDRRVHEQASRSIMYLTILTLVFVVVFAIAVLALWNRTLFKRLAELGKDIKAIGSGEETARIRTSGNDEIATIANLLNTTLDRLHKSQTDLMDERERLTVTLASIGDAVIATDAWGKVTFMNRVAESLTTWTQAEAVGRDISEIMVLVDEETGNPIENPAKAAINQGSIMILPEGTLLVRCDGSRLPVDDSAAPIRNRDGRLVGSVVVFRDVSERRAAHLKIRDSETRLRTIWHSMRTGIAIIDAQTHEIVDMNDVAAGMIGCDRSQIIGRQCRNFLCPHGNGNCLVSGSTSTVDYGEYTMQTVSGERIDILKTMVRIELNGRPHNLETFTDISDRKKAEKALIQTSEELKKLLARNRAILETSAVGIMVTDGNRRITEVNGRVATMFGCKLEDIIGTDPGRFFVSEEDFLSFIDLTHPRLSNGQDALCERKLRRMDGTLIWCELSGRAINPQDTSEGTVWMVIDITERKRTTQTLETNQFAMDHASDCVFWIDSEARFTYVNETAVASLGYSREELLRMSVFDIDSALSGQQWPEHWKTLKETGYANRTSTHRTKDGREYPVEICSNYHEFGDSRQVITFARDITDRKNHELLLDRQARYDTLTGLPNRLVFNETLAAMVSGKRKSEARLGVMFIDLDRFKSVNDTLGHDAGDLLLVETSKRLKECLRDTDLLCRMGGDEFTVILRHLNNIEDAEVIARRILKDMSQTFVIKGHEFHIGASIGISIYPRDAQDFSSLVKSADIAMYRAKELGRNNYQFYSSNMDVENIERLKLEQDLRHALKNGELEVYYQPRVDPMTAALVGAESLLRWNHPTRGLLQASEFIPLAEETGQILAIGEYVLTAVCKQVQCWIEDGRPPLQVSINLSEKHAFRTDFLNSISEEIQSYGIPPSCISLELPGKAFLYISEQAMQAVDALRKIGVQLILDDFGSGPLPMTALNKIPVDNLKINSALAASSIEQADDIGLLASIVATARNLGMQVIAVGVETRQHLELASSLMCDAVQGYLISPPLQIRAFEQFMARDQEQDQIGEEAA